MNTELNNHHTHNWPGWPGAFCLSCGIEEPMEQAIADGYGFDSSGEFVPSPMDKYPCPVCSGAPHE